MMKLHFDIRNSLFDLPAMPLRRFGRGGGKPRLYVGEGFIPSLIGAGVMVAALNSLHGRRVFCGSDYET